MEIRNKAQRPLRVPLPGGKKLHLGPGGSGQIPPKADQHPPLAKLIENGEIEVVDEGPSKVQGGASGSHGISGSQGGAPTRGLRRTGDR
jgi:hypothetical protein